MKLSLLLFDWEMLKQHLFILTYYVLQVWLHLNT